MPYFGKVEIEVRLMRQGHGREGADFAAVQVASIEMPEGHAQAVREALEQHRSTFGSSGIDYSALTVVAEAIKKVLDGDEAFELNQRWNDVVSLVSPEMKRKALALLEGSLKCKCGEDCDDLHPCPYGSEINNDDTPCNCCPECTQQCAWEI